MLPPIHLARTLTLVLATAASPGGTPTAPQRPAQQQEITIEVHNDNFNDATVYAIRPGLRLRLGFVGGLGKDSFTFRWPQGNLRIEIDLLANGRYYTQVMDVDQGDELQLTILPNLHTLPPGTVF